MRRISRKLQMNSHGEWGMFLTAVTYLWRVAFWRFCACMSLILFTSFTKCEQFCGEAKIPPPPPPPPRPSCPSLFSSSRSLSKEATAFHLANFLYLSIFNTVKSVAIAQIKINGCIAKLIRNNMVIPVCEHVDEKGKS